MRTQIARAAAASFIVLSLSGCSFLKAKTQAPSTAPLTSTASVTLSGSPSDSGSPTDSGSLSESGSPTDSGTVSATESASSTSTLADPNGTAEPSSTLPSSTLANPGAAAAALPLTVRDTQSHSATFPKGTTSLTFKATCGASGKLKVSYTFNSRTDPAKRAFSTTPCTADTPAQFSDEAVPADATRITMSATTEPSGELWLVVSAGN